MTYDDEQRVRTALAAAAAADGLQTPDRVEAALLAALRRRRYLRVARRAAAAGAVAALFFIGFYLARPTVPAVEAPPALPVVSEAAPLAPAPRPEPPAVLNPVVRTATARRRPAAPPRVPTTADASADFIPVGPWQAIEPMERGSIVRVRLPKSSLPGLGIPVSAERWNEFIPADVLLGEDGSMRAVRFVTVKQ